MNKKLLSDSDIIPIKEALWDGVDRLAICITYGIKECTLTRFINKHFRDEVPPGNSRPWKDLYQVYDDGRVWTKRIYSWFTPWIDKDGYATLSSPLEERKLHRLILRVFDREPKEGEVARHLDGNVENNHLSNLQWSTTLQNQYDRVKMGRHFKFPNFKRQPSFFVTKTYGHEVGLSACFRQWRAQSHCSVLHGYPLSFIFTFSCSELDNNGWVIDYGSLKPIKKWLEEHFDHKLLIAHDDPLMDELLKLDEIGAASVVIVQDAGCEAFAKMAYFAVEKWLTEEGYSPRVWIQKVEVKEHGANSVVYEPFSFDNNEEFVINEEKVRKV